MGSPVQTDIQVQEGEEVEEAAVEAFKLADHQASYDPNDSAFQGEDEY